ncbi:hypothetical protein NCF85_01655 [Qipengyuania citrea]|uniref:Uncharacterized protein n=1 Tax=Qipengyuania citrea TaxID=225971 RepID=A0ABY4UC23_9SPHN|nr:hypothetical protein [Qipengyuania citrea]USA61715.1 hypothetical protein NCF85_01655 [Qipengyuania citrea]
MKLSPSEGMKIRNIQLITETESKVATAHVVAIQRMLLKGIIPGQGLAFSAGYKSDASDIFEIGGTAHSSQHDIVHLGFEWIDSEFRLTEISLYIRQGRGILHIPNCRLYSASKADPAILVPPSGTSGTFTLAADQIIQRSEVPEHIHDGVNLANRWLDSLVNEARLP